MIYNEIINFYMCNTIFPKIYILQIIQVVCFNCLTLYNLYF